MECMAVAQKIQTITAITAYIVTLKYSLWELLVYRFAQNVQKYQEAI